MERWIQLHPSRVADELFRMAFRRAVMPSEAFFLTGEAIPPPRGYNACLGLSYGSLRLHTERPEQKIGVELTGKDMSGLRVAGVDTIELLKWVVMRPGANVTRLDFAVDIFGSGGNPLDIWDAFVAGELVTAVRTGKPHNGKRREGDRLVDVDRGVYIGSVRGDKLLRVYDKGLESGKGGDWIRIELQLNKPFANVYAWALQDADDWQAVIRAAIRDYCDAPTVDWYSYALRGPVTRLPEVPRRDSDRKRWLLQQVIPALSAELLECEKVGDWEVYDAFMRVLERYRNR